MQVSRTRWNVIGLCVFCALVVGCEENGPPPAPGPAPIEPGDPAPTETPDVDDPTTSPAETSKKDGTDDEGDDDDGTTLKTLDWEATEKLIAGHKGKVVVVDLWSTSCLPCLKEFPHLVELQKKYEGQAACVSVNCDYVGIEDEPPESYRKDVLKFLRKKGASFDNVLSSLAYDELFEKLELASLPVVYVYGKDGKLKKRFDNEEELYGEEGFTYQKDIIPFVEKLLKEEGQ